MARICPLQGLLNPSVFSIFLGVYRTVSEEGNLPFSADKSCGTKQLEVLLKGSIKA
jgi:hypothetical protein